MRCPICRSYVEPKLDIRSLLTIVSLTILISFVGGIFFYEWKMIPKYEQKIEKDRILNDELKKGYNPPKEEKGGIKR